MSTDENDNLIRNQWTRNQIIYKQLYVSDSL